MAPHPRQADERTNHRDRKRLPIGSTAGLRTPGLTSGGWSPKYETAKDDKIAVVGHTHPLQEGEGTSGVSFSGKDISEMVNSRNRCRSCDREIALCARQTAEFLERVKDLDLERTSVLKQEIITA